MTNVNEEQTLPLRGLAMVLIAVAVMLGMWALYTFVSPSKPAAPTTVVAPQSTGQVATPEQAANPEQAATPEQAANPEQPEQPANNIQAEAPKLVNVLNNSTIQGLAADVSVQLESEGYQLGEVGNFADEILPETTVFFPAGDAAAEAEARALADKLGGVARENIPSLPQAATAQRSLTVVLVNQ